MPIQSGPPEIVSSATGPNAAGRIDEIVHWMQRGDLRRAAGLCQTHLAEQPDDVRALTLMGALLGQSNEPASALPPLHRARELAPHDEKVLNNLGLTHLALGDTQAARDAFEAALEIAPDASPTHLNLARLLLSLHELDLAESHYRRALEARPNSVDAMAGLAELLEHGSREDEAAAWCARVLELRPGHVGASLTLANLDLREGRFEAALERVDASLSRPDSAPLNPINPINPINRALALGTRAQALEELGRFEPAFESFFAANEVLRELFTAQFGTPTDSFASPQSIQRLRQFFAPERIVNWPREAPGDSGPAPVFLLGFPRSGTTLLDRILSTHQRVVSLEERENLADFYREFGTSSQALLRLESLSGRQLNHWRERYWAAVRSARGEDVPDSHLFVDKLPLNTILLGFIARLFPDARIIFAVRDPRDVCLSCFQQRFDLNPAMFQLLRLDTTVAYYDSVMSLGTEVLEARRLRHHVHRYERLIHEPRAALGDLLSFLGLEWDECVLDYQQTARERYTSTPSARQVVRPLYTSSIGRWKHYEQRLEPHFTALDRWVKAYGHQP